MNTIPRSFRSSAALAAILLATAGCIDSSGGSSSQAPANLELTLSIAPVEIGTWTGLKATFNGTLKEGGFTKVSELTWSVTPAGPTFSDLTGASAGVTAWTAGTYTIKAGALGVEATAKLVVQGVDVPPDPGLVIGTVHAPAPGVGLTLYPSDGGEPTNVQYIKRSSGVVADGKGEGVYFMNHTAVPAPGLPFSEISRYDLKTKVSTLVATIVHADWGGGRACGLEQDADGFLYTLIMGADAVLKIDPVTAEIVFGGDSQGGIELGVATVDGVTSIYTAPLTLGMAPGTWITKVGTGVWWTDPSFWDGSGLCSGGIAANDRGEVFAADMISDRVFRYIDLNLDGDAADAGESTLIMTTPADHLLNGLACARGGTLLVNVFKSTFGTASAGNGLHWLVDMNKDGDYADANEIRLFNAIPSFNGETQSNLTSWWR